MPQVSVIVPVFNTEKYIEKAVQSVLQQTFDDFELIIVDDASTDNTYAICKALAETDPRIRLYKNEANLGMMPNWNKALEYIRGAYWAKLDGDDWWDRDFLLDCYSVISKDQAVGMVCGRYICIDGQDKLIPGTEYMLPPAFRNKKTDFLWRVKRGVHGMFVPALAQQGNGLIRTQFIRDHGKYLLLQAGDTEFYFRIAAHYEIFFLDKLYHYHRVWSGSDTQSTIKNRSGVFEQNIYETRQAIFDYYYKNHLIDKAMYRSFTAQNRYELNKAYFSVHLQRREPGKALRCILENLLHSPLQTVLFYTKRVCAR